MSNTTPPHQTEPQGTEGISTRMWVSIVVVGAAILAVVFFTWFQNTQNLDTNVNNPVSGTGSNVTK